MLSFPPRFSAEEVSYCYFDFVHFYYYRCNTENWPFYQRILHRLAISSISSCLLYVPLAILPPVVFTIQYLRIALVIIPLLHSSSHWGEQLARVVARDLATETAALSGPLCAFVAGAVAPMLSPWPEAEQQPEHLRLPRGRLASGPRSEHTGPQPLHPVAPDLRPSSGASPAPSFCAQFRVSVALARLRQPLDCPAQQGLPDQALIPPSPLPCLPYLTSSCDVLHVQGPRPYHPPPSGAHPARTPQEAHHRSEWHQPRLPSSCQLACRYPAILLDPSHWTSHTLHGYCKIGRIFSASWSKLLITPKRICPFIIAFYLLILLTQRFPSDRPRRPCLRLHYLHHLWGLTPIMEPWSAVDSEDHCHHPDYWLRPFAVVHRDRLVPDTVTALDQHWVAKFPY